VASLWNHPRGSLPYSPLYCKIGRSVNTRFLQRSDTDHRKVAYAESRRYTAASRLTIIMIIPSACTPDSSLFVVTFVAIAFRAMCRFRRFLAGHRKARGVLNRTPFLLIICATVKPVMFGPTTS
jgi:hypothetical protein